MYSRPRNLKFEAQRSHFACNFGYWNKFIEIWILFGYCSTCSSVRVTTDFKLPWGFNDTTVTVSAEKFPLIQHYSTGCTQVLHVALLWLQVALHCIMTVRRCVSVIVLWSTIQCEDFHCHLSEFDKSLEILVLLVSRCRCVGTIILMLRCHILDLTVP